MSPKKETKAKEASKNLVIIRIHGCVSLTYWIEEALNRLNLRRKYACTVLPDNEQTRGMVFKVKDQVAYGTIDDEAFKELILKRGKAIDATKKINPETIVEGRKNGKRYQDMNLKPVFRLHPPRGGIDARKHFGVNKGVLGNHKDKINELIKRML